MKTTVVLILLSMLLQNLATNFASRQVEVGIVGGGIGGLALARALQLSPHFRVSVFERDPSLSFRNQGYAITIQQASLALVRLGLLEKVMAEDVACSSHYTFTSQGQILACFGPALSSKNCQPQSKNSADEIKARVNKRERAEKWRRLRESEPPSAFFRRNWHIPRQRLREILYESLLPGTVEWGHRLMEMRMCGDKDASCVACASVEAAPCGEVNGEAGRGNAGGGGTGERAFMEVADRKGVDIGCDGRWMEGQIEMQFEVGGEERRICRFDLVVGCDGIRSTVREHLLSDPGCQFSRTETGANEETDTLNYLGVMVILGISSSSYAPSCSSSCAPSCSTYPPANSNTSLASVSAHNYELLRSDDATARVFQSVDGASRVFVMPFNKTHTFWQLSFGVCLPEAERLRGNSFALRHAALSRCGDWHAPIPQLIRESSCISGYPVFDRQPEPLDCKPTEHSKHSMHSKLSNNMPPHQCITQSDVRSRCLSQQGLACMTTLLGDSSHPMSPFKGQGANQALLDALLLADTLLLAVSTSLRADNADNAGEEATLHELSKASGEGCERGNGNGVWDGHALCQYLRRFEAEMTSRARPKVLASRALAQSLHTAAVLSPFFHGIQARGMNAEVMTRLQEAGVGASTRNLDKVVRSFFAEQSFNNLQLHERQEK